MQATSTLVQAYCRPDIAFDRTRPALGARIAPLPQVVKSKSSFAARPSEQPPQFIAPANKNDIEFIPSRAAPAAPRVQRHSNASQIYLAVCDLLALFNQFCVLI